MPNLYIIGGCNGAGKTTASFTILPEMLNCREFVNADEIARGLSPFSPEKVSFEAGRIMLHRINGLLNSQITFAFETTLSTISYLPLIRKARSNGYIIILIFFWLESAELAIKRVQQRVLNGGHNIEEPVIKRRYVKGLRNLFKFITEVDQWTAWDNSVGESNLIASGKGNEIMVFNSDIWNKFKEYAPRK